MQTLITSAKQVLQQKECLPFSVYSSVKEQYLLNVPVIKPLLIFVLEGNKQLGGDIRCSSGDFIFLSNKPTIDMRNIPNDNEYFALLIEFDYSDFNCFESRPAKAVTHLQGTMDSVLISTLQQFVEWSVFAPPSMWSVRKQEILQLIYHLGYTDISAMVEAPSISHRVHDIITEDVAAELHADELSKRLAMSESTLRRKLHAEGTSVQHIKDRSKLGYGLHLVQTTFDPIGRIAEQCGYQSQSRFTDRFKQLFGMTPTELRKTRV